MPFVVPDLLAEDTGAAPSCLARQRQMERAHRLNLADKVRRAPFATAPAVLHQSCVTLAMMQRMLTRCDHVSQENIAPNVAAQLRMSTDRTKRTRRPKAKVAAAPVAAAPVAAAPAPAHAEQVQSEASRKQPSPRASKQRRLHNGASAVVRRCPGLGADASWNISPPFGRVQERHIAWALHAKATRSRGASTLATSSSNIAPQIAEVDRLSSGVASCDIEG